MTKAKWSILFYIAAHNNLDEMGQRSLSQIYKLGSSDAVKLAALYDGPKGAKRYLFKGPEQGNPGETHSFDSGDPQGLWEMAQWAFGESAAERYGLVLWSHGTGWMPKQVETVQSGQINFSEVKLRAGNTASSALFRTTLKKLLDEPTATDRAICFDDGSQHALDTKQLADVIGKITQQIGQPLDLLGLDACMMASLEVAYELRNNVRYLVASEETVPGTSWPYDTILSALMQQSSLTGGTLAKLIVEQYANHYTQNSLCPVCGDVTKVALNLAKIDTVAQALRQLAEALLSDPAQIKSVLWHAQRQTWLAESLGGQRRPNKFDFHLWDLGSVSAAIAQSTPNKTVKAAAQAVMAALQPDEEGAVLANRHLQDWFSGIGGVSVYLAPRQMTRITKYYKDMALAADTRWGELLETYHKS
jgi:hypothetical protein